MRLLIFLATAMLCAGQTAFPDLNEGDYVIRDYQFRSGETLPELKLHYTTIGTPVRDSNAVVRNAVLILHGTGGTGSGLLNNAVFSGRLFGAGQPLDANKHYVIFPDNVGHGKSSKPSDGLRTRFPKYGYADMVALQHRLLTEKLGVNHLRLVLGTSMGCMHSWMWGEEYPTFVDALMPLACLPWPITGRNLMWRRAAVDMIRNDPGYRGGEYTEQPRGLYETNYIYFLITANPLDLQKRGATRAEAEKVFEETMRRMNAAPLDANDRIYQLGASRDYDPSGNLERIEARVCAVNFADDPINPPELGIFEREVRRVKRGKGVLMPATESTRGHSTHSMPVFWSSYLEELLRN